jgi:hypothetical protein
VIDGPTAPDDITMAAIRAIKAIPERVVYADKALVDAARVAYNKIATTEQQALVTNYADLITAEQRIIALTPQEEAPVVTTPEFTFDFVGLLIIVIVAAVLCGGAYAVSKYNVQLKALFAKVLSKKKDESVDEVEDDEVEVEFYEIESNEEVAEEATEVEEDETKN